MSGVNFRDYVFYDIIEFTVFFRLPLIVKGLNLSVSSLQDVSYITEVVIL